MPKAYISMAERKKAKYKQRIKALLAAKMAEGGYTQSDLGNMLELTQGAVSQRIANGTLTLVQMMILGDFLQFTDSDLEKLFERRD